MKNVKLMGVIALCLFGCYLMKAANIIVHTIGDSTMANYDESTSEIRGWGMMFQQFFKDGVTINNRGKSGASSKSFYLEPAYWTTVKQQINKGDYVLIQFAHNDEKTTGTDGDSLKAYYASIGDATSASTVDYRGTTASDTYKNNLRKYVNETRELGGIPVLVSSMCRKYFSGNTITRTGRHDLGDKFNLIKDGKLFTAQSVGIDDHSYDYPYQMEQVAKEMNVPYIDLTSLTKATFESYGPDACTQLLFVSTDGTHPSAMGGTLVARLCAKEMVRQGILADYINTSTDLTLYPTTADLGPAYTGQTLTKEFSISGFDLTPASGTVTITAPKDFSISKTKDGTYQDTIQFSYNGGNINYSKFYIQCRLTTPGTYSGMITATNGYMTKTSSISANCVMFAGGTKATAYWRLESDASYTVDGPANVLDESWSGMYVQKYSNPNTNTTWPANTGFDATRKTQRNLIVGDAWPAGEIDEVSTRYVQFGLKANEGTILNIDSIGMYVCGCGGNGMRCRIWYSANEDFSNAKVIQEFQSMTANNMYAVEATPILKLDSGQSVFVRIYPWYSSAATGKTICVSDVTIRGVAMTNSGIKNFTATDNALADKIYFSCNGMQRQKPQKGINIIKTTDKNGKTKAKKIFY